jgi:hypothetical protein
LPSLHRAAQRSAPQAEPDVRYSPGIEGVGRALGRFILHCTCKLLVSAEQQEIPAIV